MSEEDIFEVIDVFEDWLNERFPLCVPHYRFKYLISDLEELEDKSFNEILNSNYKLRQKLSKLSFDANDTDLNDSVKISIQTHLADLEREEASEFDDWD